jgi:hemoglobin-like flavoprotein
MTPTQIALVQQSFRKVSPHGETVAALFYHNLFALDPLLRPLFKSDLKMQGRKLMGMLAMVVAGLDRIEALLPAVKALGARHAGYGVEPQHYDIVAAALLQTLEQGLGAAFAPPVRAAWTEAYAILADAMAAATPPIKAAA